MRPILIDTDILIDITNDDTTAKSRLRRESEVAILAVSTIAVMELTLGCRNKAELQALQEFLAQFLVGWVEGRNPTTARVALGFASHHPTYELSEPML